LYPLLLFLIIFLGLTGKIQHQGKNTFSKNVHENATIKALGQGDDYEKNN
jgi:hypothetical protein